MAALIPFRALRPRPSDAAQVAAVPYDVVTTERSEGARRRQPAQLSAGVSRGDRVAAVDQSLRRRGLRARAAELRAAEGTVAGPRGGAVVVPLPSPDGAARADRTRRVLLAGRVRPRHHQEARADAGRQGRRPHAAHDRARRADGPGVSHLPRVGRRRCDRGPGRRPGTAVRLRGGGRRASHDLEGPEPGPRGAGRGVRADSGAVHRRRPPSRGQRRTSARARGRRRTRLATAPTSTLFLPSRFLTTRSRSSRTTASCKDLGALSPAQFLEAVRERFIVAAGSAGAGAARRHRHVLPERMADAAGRASRPIRRMPSDRWMSASCRTLCWRPSWASPTCAPTSGSISSAARGARRSSQRLVDSGQAAVAFSLFPVSVADLMAVSDAGAIMPPKSTWFEPKLRDGLLIHVI